MSHDSKSRFARMNRSALALTVSAMMMTGLVGGLPAFAQATIPPLKLSETCAKLDKVRIANTGHVLIFLGGNMAKTSGIFKKLCLDVEFINTNAQVEGLLSGQLEFIEPNTMEAVKVFAANKSVIGVAPMLRCYTNSLVVRKAVAERLGLTRQSPLEDRLKALKGLRLGVTNISQGAGLWVLLLLNEGKIAFSDVSIHQLDDAPGMMAAFRTGQLDALSSGSPAGEQLENDGVGYRLITGPGGDYPAFGPQSGFPYTSIITTGAYAKANPDIVTRVVAGYMWANAKIQSDKEGVRATTKTTMFPNLQEPVFNAAYDFTYPCFAGAEDRFTQGHFESVVRIANLGRKNAGLPEVTRVKMNDILTNEFIDRATPLLQELMK